MSKHKDPVEKKPGDNHALEEVLQHFLSKVENVSLYVNSAPDWPTSVSQMQQHEQVTNKQGNFFEIISRCAAQKSVASLRHDCIGI